MTDYELSPKRVEDYRVGRCWAFATALYEEFFETHGGVIQMAWGGVDEDSILSDSDDTESSSIVSSIAENSSDYPDCGDLLHAWYATEDGRSIDIDGKTNNMEIMPIDHPNWYMDHMDPVQVEVSMQDIAYPEPVFLPDEIRQLRRFIRAHPRQYHPDIAVGDQEEDDYMVIYVPPPPPGRMIITRSMSRNHV
jgi:hypothetical protein